MIKNKNFLLLLILTPLLFGCISTPLSQFDSKRTIENAFLDIENICIPAAPSFNISKSTQSLSREVGKTTISRKPACMVIFDFNDLGKLNTALSNNSNLTPIKGLTQNYGFGANMFNFQSVYRYKKTDFYLIVQMANCGRSLTPQAMTGACGLFRLAPKNNVPTGVSKSGHWSMPPLQN